MGFDPANAVPVSGPTSTADGSNFNPANAVPVGAAPTAPAPPADLTETSNIQSAASNPSVIGRLQALGRKYADTSLPTGLGETALHMASGIPAFGRAAGESIYQLLTSKPGLAARNASSASAKALQDWTYQPRSTSGKAMSGAVDTGLSWLGPKEGEMLKDYALQQGANPYVAAGLDVAANVPMAIMGRGLPGKYTTAPAAGEASNAALALAKLRTSLRRDKTTLEEAGQKVQDLNQQGVPARLPDVAGPNTTAVAEAIAQHPGEGGTTMVTDRGATHADTQTRVPQQVRAALQTSGEDAGTQELRLSRARSDNAKTNYEAVRQDSTPVTDPDIWHILETPYVANLYQMARGRHMQERSLATAAGTPSPPLADIFAPKVGGKAPPLGTDLNLPAMGGERDPLAGIEWERTGAAPDVRSLDYLQRAMDDKATELFKDKTTGGMARNLVTLRKQLIDKLQNISPAFKEAFKTYGNDSDVIEAFDHGRSGGFMKLTPEVARNQINAMSESARNALRDGVAESLLDKLESSATVPNVAAKVMGGPKTAERLRTLFDNDRDFDLFQKAMEVEAKIHANTGRITAGSQTYRRGVAAEDFESAMGEKIGRVASIINQFMHGWGGSAMHGLMRLMHKGTYWNEGMADHVANVLSSKDPIVAAQQLQGLADTADKMGPLLKTGIGLSLGPAPAARQTNPQLQQLQQKYDIGNPAP